MGELVSLSRARVKRDPVREPWLTKGDLADSLSFSVRWVEIQVANGMPHQRMGGRLRFQLTAVERWLAEQSGEGVRSDRV